MTEAAPRPRPASRWRALALLATAVVLLAGCDLATGTVRTATELQRAGFRNPNLNYNDGVATVEYDADPSPLQARQEQDQAARIIWRNLPFRIERITVIPNGGVLSSRDYPRALLEEEFGPRPARLDRSVGDIARRATLIAAVISLVVLVLIIVVIVLVVRAVRKRPVPQPAGPWPGPGPQPWGQPGQPGPPPAWNQPAPPPQQPWGAQPGSGQSGYGPPPDPGWSQQPPPQPPPPAPQAEPPSRGPGDTQRLEPDPPPPEGGRGPVPPS